MSLSLQERQPLAVRAAVVAAVTAVVHVLVVTGLVPESVEGPVAAAVDSVGALVFLLWGMRSVVPTAKVVTRVTTKGSVVAGDAAVEPTGAGLGPEGVTVRPELVNGREYRPKHRAD